MGRPPGVRTRLGTWLYSTVTQPIGTFDPQVRFANDSLRRQGGDYQVVATTAGTKNILYRGRFTIPALRDVLFVTVPSIAGTPGVNSSGVAIVAKIQGDGGRGGLIPSM
jgi:hypothetical protein